MHYYRSYGHTYDLHPEVKIFYDGQQFADLGPQGFYSPTAPVTFHPSDSAGAGASATATGSSRTSPSSTTAAATSPAWVQPVYADPTSLTPYLTLDTEVTDAFAPPWPPPPL